jgi:hypothetical protein
MRMLRALVAAMVVTASATLWGYSLGRTSHVRCLTPSCRTLLSRALDGSPVVRGFLAELERSDVIVLLQTVTSPPRERHVKGSLRFVAFTGGQRLLLVEVDAFGPMLDEQVALLGHELRHALEVAAAPDVRDEAGLRRLYERIGIQWGRGRFETEEAKTAERSVRADMAAARFTHKSKDRGEDHA